MEAALPPPPPPLLFFLPPSRLALSRVSLWHPGGAQYSAVSFCCRAYSTKALSTSPPDWLHCCGAPACCTACKAARVLHPQQTFTGLFCAAAQISLGLRSFLFSTQCLVKITSRIAEICRLIKEWPRLIALASPQRGTPKTANTLFRCLFQHYG